MSSKRSKLKYPALTKGVNSRVKQEKIDFDYLDKLNPEEMAWMNKFMEEEMNGRFAKDGTDFNQTDEERRRIYGSINSANRCLYGLTKAKVEKTHILNYEDKINIVEKQIHDRLPAAQPIEDVYLDFLENETLAPFIKEFQTVMKKFNEDCE
jgi:hypothetical protein